MADIWAQNDKGEKRRFTDVAWKFLPVDKNGMRDGKWFAAPDAIIENIAPTLSKPNTGQIAKTIVIENKVEKTNDIVIQDVSVNKEAFLKAVEGFKKGDIKDYFDKKEIEYKNNASTSDLVNQLGEVLKFDIIELQKAFN